MATTFGTAECGGGGGGVVSFGTDMRRQTQGRSDSCGKEEPTPLDVGDDSHRDLMSNGRIVGRRRRGEFHPHPLRRRQRWRLTMVVVFSAFCPGGVLERRNVVAALVVVRPSHPPRSWSPSCSTPGEYSILSPLNHPLPSSTPHPRRRRRGGGGCASPVAMRVALRSTPETMDAEGEDDGDHDRDENRDYLRDAIVALRGADDDYEDGLDDDLDDDDDDVVTMDADGIVGDGDRLISNSTTVTTTWHYSELCPAEDKTCSNWNPPPATKSLSASLLFFVRYLGRFVAERRRRRRRGGRKTSIIPAIFRKSEVDTGIVEGAVVVVDEAGPGVEVVEVDVDTSRGGEGVGEEEVEPEMSVRETLSKLNASRRALVQLCGYDADLLKPAFAFLLLGALFESVRPQFYSSCITCVVNREPHGGKVVRALVGLTITSILGALFTGLRGALFWIAGSRGNYNVRVKLHRNLLRQEAAFFDSTETGVLISRLNNDVNKIGMVVSFHVNVVLRQLAQFLIGSVFLVRMNARLSVFAFAGIGLVAYISALYGTFARYLSQKVQDMLADAAAVAETSFSMSETVRAFNGIPVESSRYEGAQGRSLELEEVQAWTYGLHKLVSDTLQYSLQGCLLFACWRVGRTGGIPPARLTSFLFYVHYVLESSNEVGDQWAKIQSAIGGSSSVFDLIRRVPKIRDADLVADVALPRLISTDPAVVDAEIIDVDGTSSIDVAGGEGPPAAVISMRNMTVTYGTMDVPALDNINIEFYPGDRVAIVGRSGSGKSSMLRTILRFYDPSGGSCSVSGRDLKELTRSEIARSVSVVQQEPEVFPMTLMENVLYGIERDSVDERTGEPSYSDEYRESVAHALDLAGLPVQFMKKFLGLDLDTRIGEGGRTLSGGQRQRVAIARALVRSPDVLLLDEPTAALDSKSEKVVVKALKNAMEKTRCLVMVTHRLGVVRSLDINKVIVLERGQIAEVDHPENLLQRGGMYAQLAAEQGIFPQKIDGEEQALRPPSRSVGHVAP